MNKQQFFDTWASSYDWLLPSVFYQAAHQHMMSYVNIEEQANVLDIGCGTGRLLYRLAEQYPDISGIGIDFSPEMLRQARQRRGDRTRLIFIQGRADSLRFADEQFDTVFCTFSFMHYPDPDRVLAEVHRVLKPGGQFYLLDPLLSSACRIQHLPLSPRGIRFYSAGDRDALAQHANFSPGRHYPIFFVSLLSIFETSSGKV